MAHLTSFHHVWVSCLLLVACTYASVDGDSIENGVPLPKRSQSAEKGDGNATTEQSSSNAGGGDGAPNSQKQTPPTTTTTTTSCPTQDVSWTQGTSSCAISLGASLGAGETRTLTDSTLEHTGKVVVTCESGKIVLSKAVCEPPKLIDVSGQSGCINGSCMAAVGGKCGVPDPIKADAICTVKGYSAHTTFATAPGPDGLAECHADGSGCFVNANPSCNIVFTSVTCRH